MGKMKMMHLSEPIQNENKLDHVTLLIQNYAKAAERNKNHLEKLIK